MKTSSSFFCTDAMSECYAILWIPTVKHAPIPFESPLNNGERIENISDIDDEPFRVKVKTNGRNIDIFVQNTDDLNDFSHFLTLKYKDFSHNGMVKYSFEPKFIEDDGFGFDHEHFPEVVYHIIKGFYHIHEFHEDETDSSLTPYLTKNDIDIHERDNAAIQHYLRNHERNVLVLVDRAKDYLRTIVDKEKNNPSFVLKDFDTFQKMYVMVLGYDTYIHSIYDSVYNKECRTSNDKSRVLRHCAFNIENSVRYFNVLYIFFDTKIRKNNTLSILRNAESTLRNSEQSLLRLEATFDMSRKSLETSETNLSTSLKVLEKTKDSAKSSTIWAIISIIISFILGICSIIYSIKLSKESSRELQETRLELKNTIDNSVRRNEQKLDSLNDIIVSTLSKNY